ncbi:sialate O-acetylesterase [Rhodopirellula sp. SWK7]|uniref:sialate O-acetylesterase n=1 Tax=Rhodopirellula sp. SWK7 TaxID=595460 RepID=UPI0002BE06B5|nr:sialate O-acetylesterase [Rhodopirellula sp. SWK7]EMI44310.1 sialic acid-specific 9-O-acetylesterase [Rhodopirellula sp. SWK7]
MHLAVRVARQTIAFAMLWVLMFSAAFAAEVKPLRVAGIFGDQMVLQQQSVNPIWGTAEANSPVSVNGSWSDQTVSTVADGQGNWRVELETPAAGGPFSVTIKTSDDELQLSDVYVGEVWICSGQSNMQWRMRGFGVDHFKEDVEKANYPRIRYTEVPAMLALEGQDDVDVKWTVCDPQTVLNLSAVGYFFGSQLHQELDVPIGLVSTNWGGSSAEAWVSPDVLREQFPEFNEVLDGYPAIMKNAGVKFMRGQEKPKGLNQRSPALLYNSMIRPLIPFSFRGVIWYQGESNVQNPKQYQTLFPAMIRDWRTRWGQGDFPFYFVQIAPFAYKTNPMSAAFLREAQMMSLTEPNTGMVVTMDIGDATNIHPKQKKPVGERLAKMALARDYGRTDLVDDGPLYQNYSIEDGAIRLTFTELGGGLVARDGKALSHFTIAGADKKFVEAEAVIDGDSIIVSSENVPDPVAVRFGWGSGDMPNLSNKAGLPASSFRTDDWPIQ